MQKEITITVDEETYEALNRVVGPARISEFIESLIRPHLIDTAMDSAYQQMAQDESRESEALDCAEATVGDAAE